MTTEIALALCIVVLATIVVTLIFFFLREDVSVLDHLSKPQGYTESHTTWAPEALMPVDDTWTKADKMLIESAMYCVDELVALQRYLDELQEHFEEESRVDTPEFTIKMITLLIARIGDDTTSSELAQKLVESREPIPVEEEVQSPTEPPEEPTSQFLGS